jgi:hypothetical protein
VGRLRQASAEELLPGILRGFAGALDRLADFWDLVSREDVGIVERVQEGLKNWAYGGGRMCYGFEEPIHRFQNMVIARMVGIQRVPPGDAEEGRPNTTHSGLCHTMRDRCVTVQIWGTHRRG